MIALPPQHQTVLDRFVAACRADARVVAAWLGGSYARGTPDAYSDLDLCLITADAAYDDFVAGLPAFIRLLGDPLFLEEWKDYGFAQRFFILADGTKGELGVGRAGAFTQISGGQHRVLLDKTGILAGAVFPGDAPPPEEQLVMLHRLIYWFWHDLHHHFVPALARGRLWSARGHLDELRLTCIDLARLRQDFAAVADGYEKLELALPVEQVAPLAATFCPLERAPILQAARIVVAFYRELAQELAQAHGIAYPAELDRLVTGRLEQVGQATAGDGC